LPPLALRLDYAYCWGWPGRQLPFYERARVTHGGCRAVPPRCRAGEPGEAGGHCRVRRGRVPGWGDRCIPGGTGRYRARGSREQQGCQHHGDAEPARPAGRWQAPCTAAHPRLSRAR